MGPGRYLEGLESQTAEIVSRAFNASQKVRTDAMYRLGIHVEARWHAQRSEFEVRGLINDTGCNCSSAGEYLLSLMEAPQTTANNRQTHRNSPESSVLWNPSFRGFIYSIEFSTILEAPTARTPVVRAPRCAHRNVLHASETARTAPQYTSCGMQLYSTADPAYF